jgi:hypothetical protein
MRGKLIKTRDNGFLTYVLKGEDKRTIAMTRYPFPSESIYLAKSHGIELQKLSPENCDEIFGIVDFEKLAEEYARTAHDIIDEPYQNGLFYGFMTGSKKTMELNKDKVFTESDIFSVVNHILSKLVKVDGFDQKYLFPEEVYQEVTWKTKQIQQPTEIEVMVEMECKIGCEHLVLNGKNSLCCGNKIPKLDSNGCLILKKI